MDVKIPKEIFKAIIETIDSGALINWVISNKDYLEEEIDIDSEEDITLQYKEYGKLILSKIQAEIDERNKEVTEKIHEAYDKEPDVREALINEATQMRSDIRVLDKLVSNYNECFTYIESNEIVFENEDDVSNELTLELIQGLTLESTDAPYYGIYNIYKSGNGSAAKLINSADAYVDRTVTASFSSVMTRDEDIDKIEWIKWYIPKNNTMITEPALYSEYSEGELINDNDWYIIKRTTMTVDSEKSTEAKKVISAKQTFRIKPNYIKTYTNNTIRCVVHRYQKDYEATVDIKFGVHGTNGTDYTLLLRMGNEYDSNDVLYRSNVSAWTDNTDTGNYIQLISELYDANDRLVEDKVNFNWEIVSPNNEIYNMFSVGEKDGKLTCKVKNPLGADYPGAIVRCEAYFNNTQGKATICYGYICIPVRSYDTYLGCNGPDSVIYDSRGTLSDFNDVPYSIVSHGASIPLEGAFVKTYPHNEDQLKWYPQVSKNLQLLPNKIFVTDVDYDALVQCCDVYQDPSNYNVVWSQPILILQDPFGSSVLNK